MSCCNFSGSKISHVKQHVYRSHKHLYCPVCSATFSNERERDEHIRQRSCPERPRTECEGITAEQEERIREPPPRHLKLTEEKQWFYVFGIIFPDQPLPSSPYNNSDLSPEMAQFQEFMTSRGLEIQLRTLSEDAWWTAQDAEFFSRHQVQGSMRRGLGNAIAIWASLRNPSAAADSLIPSTACPAKPRPPAAALPRGNPRNPVPLESRNDTSHRYGAREVLPHAGGPTSRPDSGPARPVSAPRGRGAPPATDSLDFALSQSVEEEAGTHQVELPLQPLPHARELGNSFDQMPNVADAINFDEQTSTPGMAPVFWNDRLGFEDFDFQDFAATVPPATGGQEPMAPWAESTDYRQTTTATSQSDDLLKSLISFLEPQPQSPESTKDG